MSSVRATATPGTHTRTARVDAIDERSCNCGMCSKEVLQASIDERSRNFGMCRKEMLQASIDERSCNFGMCRKQLLQASIDERSGTCSGPMLWDMFGGSPSQI